jgi:Ni,Fe-hydrogenase III small subunit
MWRTIRLIARNGIRSEPLPAPDDALQLESGRLREELLDILGRALAIRQVDAGSCNGCELEIHALNNPYYNLEGAGIKFVASPRHADLLLVTGPVSRNMAQALRRTYDAVPEPKLVVAAGQCAENLLPVDVAVPGCPPPPIEILRGILSAVRRRR